MISGRYILFYTLFFIIVILSVFTFYFNIKYENLEFLIEYFQTFGYIGSYLAAFLSTIIPFSPIPSPFLIPFFVETGLNMKYIVITFILGAYTTNTIHITLLYVAREYFYEKHKKLVEFVRRVHKKFPLLPYIIASLWFAVLPNELMLIPMILLGYKIRYIVLILFTAEIFYYILLGNFSLSVFNFI